MNDFIPGRKEASGEVAPQKSLNLDFAITREGQLQIAAEGTTPLSFDGDLPGDGGRPLPRPHRRLHMQLTLFSQSGTPVLNENDPNGIITYNVPAAQVSGDPWRLSLMNVDDQSGWEQLSVTYPTDVEVRTWKMALTDFNNLLNEVVFAGLSVDIADRVGTITWPSRWNLRPHLFGMPEFNYDKWWTPHIREYVDHISSSSVTAVIRPDQTSEAALDITIDFVSPGRHTILGTWWGQIEGLTLKMTLRLSAFNAKIQITGAESSLSWSSFDFIDVPDWLVDLLSSYKDEIKRDVAIAVTAALTDPDARRQFANGVQNGLAPLLGPNPQVVSMQVLPDSITLTYFIPQP